MHDAAFPVDPERLPHDLAGLRQGGPTLEALADAVPALLWIADREGRITYVNSRWIEYTGFTSRRLNDQRAKPPNIVHPNDVQRTWDLWRRSLETGVPYETSYRLRSARDGTYRWFVARAFPLRDQSGQVALWVGTATDVDAEVRANAGSRFFTESAAVLSSSLEREKLLRDFTRLAVDLFCDACFAVERDSDGTLRLVAVAHQDRSAEGDVAAFAHALCDAKGGIVERVATMKEPLVVSDVAADPTPCGLSDAAHRALIARMEIHSFIVVPLLVGGSLVGLVGLASTDATRVFTASDVDIAAATARQAALAFENARSFQRERDSTERFRFLARVTDELSTSLDERATVQRLINVIVSGAADWALALLALPRGGFRVEAVAHRDPEGVTLLEELLHQRIFVAETERRIMSHIRHHRAMVTNDIQPAALRATVHPPYAHVVSPARVRVRSSVVTPLFVGDNLHGAVVAYRNDPSAPITETDRELFEEIGRRASLRLEHESSFERERHLARTLQEATLPAQLPFISGALLSSAYFPATTDLLVGGDWYDAFELGDGRYLFTIGDVTGHGLQASVVMAKLRHYCNVIAMYESDPARILDAAERILLQRYPDVIATAFLVVFDPREQRIAYSNAGHPPPVVRLRDGSLIKLEAEGLPVGLRRMGSPAQSKARTSKDIALLAFYTDGLIEATRDIEQGERRLRAAVAKEAVLFTRSAASYIATSCLPAKSHDDVALVVISFPHSVVWTFDADDAASAQRARKEFIAQLREDGSEASDFAASELIFGELVGNVVRHAPGAIDIALEWRDGSALLHVIDRGRGFNVRRTHRVDPMSEDGRGLWLVHLLARDLRLERLPHFGNHVRVALPVSPKEETPRRGGVPEVVHREGLERPTDR